MSSEQVATEPVADAERPGEAAADAVVALARPDRRRSSPSTSSPSSLFPPFPRDGAPGDACAFPVCFIEGSLEFPAPHIVIDFAPATRLPTPSALVTFHPSISNTILTMWIVMALVLAGAILWPAAAEARPGPGPEPLRVRLRVAQRLRGRPRRAEGAAATSRSSPPSSCSSCSATGAASSRRSARSRSSGRRRAT